MFVPGWFFLLVVQWCTVFPGMETVPPDVLLLSALFTVHPQPVTCPLMQKVLMSSQALGLAVGL